MAWSDIAKHIFLYIRNKLFEEQKPIGPEVNQTIIRFHKVLDRVDVLLQTRCPEVNQTIIRLREVLDRVDVLLETSRIFAVKVMALSCALCALCAVYILRKRGLENGKQNSMITTIEDAVLKAMFYLCIFFAIVLLLPLMKDLVFH